MKMNGKQWTIGLVSLVVMLSAVTVTFAQTSFWDDVADRLAEKLFGEVSVPSEDFGDGEVSFGGQGRGDNRYKNSDLAAQMLIAERGISLVDTFFATSTATLQDGYTLDTIQIELNATSSAGILNPFDETIYVTDDSYVRVVLATTTSVSYQMGTTTDGEIEPKLSCAVTGTCSATTAGNASILNTASTTPAANGIYFKEDFQGTDTRDASGERHFVPVLDDEYLTCNISPGVGGNLQTGGQGVNCVFTYFRIYN